MLVYEEPNAYDVIQKDVEAKFHEAIGKSREQIETICVVGAWHGNEIATFLNNYPNATIYAFEAHPENYAVLNSRYGQTPRVKLFNSVVSDHEGTVDFFELDMCGSGSIKKFQGDKFGHHAKIKETLSLSCTTLTQVLGDIEIDLLWVDVQGAELEVLQGVDTKRCRSMFLEIHTHDFIEAWDEEPYEGQCYKEDLEAHLTSHKIHSIGLDNENGNGQGNSFWVRTPRVLMLQPGSFGDILICAPIAKWYADEGYDVYWPIREKFAELLARFSYVTPIIIDEEVLDPNWLRSDIIKCLRVWETGDYNYVLNLADRGPHPMAQLPNENFEQAKYRLSNVPFETKHSLSWTRDRDAEWKVYDKYVGDTLGYAFVHDSASSGEVVDLPEIDLPIVRCVEGHNILDWYLVITLAQEIYVTESSIWCFCDGILEDTTDKRYLLPRSDMGDDTTVADHWSREYMGDRS